MSHRVVQSGASRSFPSPHPILESASEDGDLLLIVGGAVGKTFDGIGDRNRYQAILLELGTECLGVHTGEASGSEGSNVLGFARFRLGDAAPSDLVEIVRQNATPDSAVAVAREFFESHGLKTAVCADFPGRIVDRLIRPYYNVALAKLDSKLATAADLDLTLKLGLGYPEGPIELLHRTGLAHHHDVSKALYEALGQAAYAPARRAQIAKARAGR